MSTATKQTAMRIARETRLKGATSPDTLSARRDLAELLITEAIERTLAKAPPLTDEAAERIAERLRRGSASAAETNGGE